MHADRELHIVAYGKMRDGLEHPFDLVLERALPIVKLRVPYHRGEKSDDGLCLVEPDRSNDVPGSGSVSGMECNPVLCSLLTVVEIANQLPAFVIVEIHVLPHGSWLGEHGAVIGLAMAEDEAAFAIRRVPGDEADPCLPRRVGNQRLRHIDAMMADDHVVVLSRKQPAHGE